MICPCWSPHPLSLASDKIGWSLWCLYYFRKKKQRPRIPKKKIKGKISSITQEPAFSSGDIICSSWEVNILSSLQPPIIRETSRTPSPKKNRVGLRQCRKEGQGLTNPWQNFHQVVKFIITWGKYPSRLNPGKIRGGSIRKTPVVPVLIRKAINSDNVYFYFPRKIKRK